MECVLPGISTTMHSPSPSGIISSVLHASSSIEAGDHYRLSPDVVLVAVQDGTARLLNLAGSLFAISETGALMLRAALDGRQREACDALATRFKVRPEQVRADMEALLLDLAARGLVEPPTMRRHSRPTIAGTLSWLLAPGVFACTRRSSRCIGLKTWVLLTLSYVATRLFGWTNTVRMWQRCVNPLPRALALAPENADASANIISDHVAYAIARYPFNIGCKERALSCWALARAAGLPARIVLGIDLFPFALHCWCEAHAQILADRREGRCDRYTPILTYE
jgi:hypothetical protein